MSVGFEKQAELSDIDEQAMLEAIERFENTVGSVAQKDTSLTKPKYHRFLVLEIHTRMSEKVSLNGLVIVQMLRVFNEKTNEENLVLLMQDWFYTKVKPGDYINIIGESLPSGQWRIDNTSGILITHPDILIPGTTVGQSFSCPRKAVLDQKLKV